LGAALTFPYLGERIACLPSGVQGLGLRRSARRARCTGGRARRYLHGGGKTAAASAIIARMRHRGLVVDAFKATGVSLRRDILAFEDSGARRTMILPT